MPAPARNSSSSSDQWSENRRLEIISRRRRERLSLRVKPAFINFMACGIRAVSGMAPRQGILQDLSQTAAIEWILGPASSSLSVSFFPSLSLSVCLGLSAFPSVFISVGIGPHSCGSVYQHLRGPSESVEVNRLESVGGDLGRNRKTISSLFLVSSLKTSLVQQYWVRFTSSIAPLSAL